MPGMDGFDVIGQLQVDSLPTVVIVPAYDQHAIKAFEAAALDYLLKPVSRERLEKALDRVGLLRGNRRTVAELLVHLGERVAAPAAPRALLVVTLPLSSARRERRVHHCPKYPRPSSRIPNGRRLV